MVGDPLCPSDTHVPATGPEALGVLTYTGGIAVIPRIDATVKLALAPLSSLVAMMASLEGAYDSVKSSVGTQRVSFATAIGSVDVSEPEIDAASLPPSEPVATSEAAEPKAAKPRVKKPVVIDMTAVHWTHAQAATYCGWSEDHFRRVRDGKFPHIKPKMPRGYYVKNGNRNEKIAYKREKVIAWFEGSGDEQNRVRK